MLVEKSVAPVPVLAADASLEEVREHFSHDLFVSGALGAQILEAGAGHAVCAFDLGERHLNEKGGVMGGAIFSLGDFAIVVAATVGAPDTVSVAFNVNFMSAPMGGRLIATADEDKRGRTLGFPTANLAIPDAQVMLPNGVYAATAHYEGRDYAALANIGNNPTFEGCNRRIEVNIQDFSEDIYDRLLEVRFLQKIRNEEKFASVDALIAQMHKDRERAKEIWRNCFTSD